MTKHLCVFLSAFLIYLAFPNVLTIHGFWPLAWISIVPLMRALEGRGPVERAVLGFLHGVVLYCLLLLWLFPVHVFGALAFVLALSVQSAVFSILYSRMFAQSILSARPQAVVVAMIYISALWAAGEYARTILLGGFAWGLGYSQSFQPALIQLSSWTGLYGVSFAIVLVNVLLYRGICVRDKRTWMAAIVVFAFVLAFGIWRLSTAESGKSSIKVCAIQPNIPTHLKSNELKFDDNIRHQTSLTDKAISGQKPDVIIWPETAFPADIFKDRFWYPRFQSIAVETNAFFIFGAVPIVDGKNFNSAVILDQRGELTCVYDKQFLVPMSEYKPFKNFLKEYLTINVRTSSSSSLVIPTKACLPAGRWESTRMPESNATRTPAGVYPHNGFPLSRERQRVGKGMTKMQESVHEMIWGIYKAMFEDYGFEFAAGKKPGLFSDREGQNRFGIMICSETCYPSLARGLVNKGAGWMTAILNDGWFLRPEAIMMHAQNAVFRAVESGRDIISVGNTGWTGVISAHGAMQESQQLPLQREAHGTFDVSIRHHPTLYSKIGDFFAGACGLFVIIVLSFQNKNRFKNKFI